jgi:hypothetical protein
MTNRWLLCFLLGCTPHPGAQPQPTRPQPPPPGVAVVEYEMHGTVGDDGVARIEKDQPPHIKLKLGHYRNERRGIGVTIDLVTDATENVADLDPAKLRFDGDDKVWRLQGQHGGTGRVDYVRDDGRIMLQMTRDGRATVYVPDPDTDRSSDAIDVSRDGDADPL